MKALIKKRGSKRGRYYHGSTITDIMKNFLRSHRNLRFIKVWEFNDRYEILVHDTKISKMPFYYIMPKDKISK